MRRKNGSYLVKSSWFASLAKTRSELYFGNILSPESGKVGRLLKIFSSDAVLIFVTVHRRPPPYPYLDTCHDHTNYNIIHTV